MSIPEIHIPEGEDIFKYLVRLLLPYHAEPVRSRLFIVEGTSAKPRVGIRYPGRKLRKRTELKKISDRFSLWASLMDFEVIPFQNGKEGESTTFNYGTLLQDFASHKKDSEEFWESIITLYEQNKVVAKLPDLSGIPPQQFFEMLKWMWISEDLNYKLSCKDVDSPVKYRLETKSQKPTSKGAGRAKFFAAFLLLRDKHFDLNSIRKVVRLS